MIERYKPARFYAYVHARPNTKSAAGIFYVGKGSGHRAFKIDRDENEGHQKVVDKYGADKILVGRLLCSSEETAFALEVGLIRCLRKMGARLVNKTPGGSQPPVPTWNKEADPEWYRKMTTAIRSPEVRLKKSISGRAVRASKEARKFMSDYGKASWVDAEARRQDTSVRFSSRITITDGLRERRVLPNLPIPKGWRRGRCDVMLLKMSANATVQANAPGAREAFRKRIANAKERRIQSGGSDGPSS